MTQPAVQREILAMSSDIPSKSHQYEADNISDYIRLEAPGEQIESLEKVTTRNVGFNRYDIWDVKTDHNHWWVVTPLTNLYEKSSSQIFTKYSLRWSRLSEQFSPFYKWNRAPVCQAAAGVGSALV